MKYCYLILALLIASTVNAQNKLLFDTLKVDHTTKLIGRYPQYDKEKVYKDWNFIVENPESIKTLITSFVLGEEVQNEIEEPGFTLAVVQGGKEVKTWSVNPALNSVNTGGHTYRFNMENLRYLGKQYPFHYRHEKKSFKSKEDYQAYLDKQRSNERFLFAYEPTFQHEGSFELEFPRNQTFSSPQAISDYVKPYFARLVKEDDYQFAYFLSEKNLSNQNQFTITISGSKKLYNNLQIENIKQKNWSPSEAQGWFFYRVK
jgi:hypothetical protein